MRAPYQERHQDYVLGPNQDSRLGLRRTWPSHHRPATLSRSRRAFRPSRAILPGEVR